MGMRMYGMKTGCENLAVLSWSMKLDANVPGRLGWRGTVGLGALGFRRVVMRGYQGDGVVGFHVNDIESDVGLLIEGKPASMR